MFDGTEVVGVNRWLVLRLAPGSQTEVVLLSERFFSVVSHWTAATVLCSGEDCALCAYLPARALYYLACHVGSQVRMVELGGLSASHLEQHCKLLHGGMQVGQVIKLLRRTAKSPVHSEVMRVQEGVQSVSPMLLAQRVMALYKFPPPNPSDDMLSYEARICAQVKVRNSLMARKLFEHADKTGV